LLQRTRADAVADLYDDFFATFPDPHALANASIDAVEEAIYPLGLQWRARYLSRLGGALAETNGVVRETRAEIEKLPGVGPYAAGAFLAMHRRQHASFVDANIVRLLGRYFGFEWD